MAIPKREEALFWLTINERAKDILILSEPTPWTSHWDVKRLRSRRCGGKGCAWCAKGHPRIQRIVLLVAHHAQPFVIELRDRHISELERAGGSTVGLKARIRRSGPAKNSPVEFKLLALERDESMFCQSIERFVANLGLPAQFDQELPEIKIIEQNTKTQAKTNGQSKEFVERIRVE